MQPNVADLDISNYEFCLKKNKFEISKVFKLRLQRYKSRKFEFVKKTELCTSLDCLCIIWMVYTLTDLYIYHTNIFIINEYKYIPNVKKSNFPPNISYFLQLFIYKSIKWFPHRSADWSELKTLEWDILSPDLLTYLEIKFMRKTSHI